MQSIWMATHTITVPNPGPLEDTHHDVVVVGAGITGLTTAALLARAGKKVLVLEARQVGALATGNTTAKLSLLQGTVLSDIAAHAGDDLLRAHVEAQREGQAWLVRFMDDRDVPYQRRDAYTYATTKKGDKALRAEADACATAGLPVTWTAPAELPFAATALTLPDQVQLHRCSCWTPSSPTSGPTAGPSPRASASPAQTSATAASGSRPAAALSRPTGSCSPPAPPSSTGACTPPAWCPRARTPPRTASRVRSRRGCTSAPTTPSGRCGRCRSATRSCSWSAGTGTWWGAPTPRRTRSPTSALRDRTPTPAAALGTVAPNIQIAAELAKDWVAAELRAVPDEPPAEGEGVVGRGAGGLPEGVSTVAGRTCRVRAVCTHLGGVLR